MFIYCRKKTFLYLCTSNNRFLYMELKEHFSDKIFSIISETADELGLECYVVGGYVRDIFLKRHSKDIDVVVVGSGIEIAQALLMFRCSRISEQHR